MKNYLIINSASVREVCTLSTALTPKQVSLVHALLCHFKRRKIIRKLPFITVNSITMVYILVGESMNSKDKQIFKTIKLVLKLVMKYD